jgi:TonB family protein
MTFLDSPHSFPSDGSDAWLSAMLDTWETPAVPVSLDHRVFASFQQQFTESQLPVGALAQSPSIFEVNQMKTCEHCHEAYSDQFAFCPLDGAPLIATVRSGEIDLIMTETSAESGFALPGSEAYHLTLLDDAGLIARLTGEVRAVADESRLTWPEFRRDPIGFMRRTMVAYGAMLRRSLGNANVALAAATACAIVIALVAALIIFDQYRAQKNALLAKNNEDLTLEEILNIPDVEPPAEEGHPGRDKGTGGGSKADRSDPHGGGGGGRNENTPASQGKLPPAMNAPILVAPNPKPPPPTSDPLIVPPHLDADPTLFPTDRSSTNFGDPNSKQTATSSGPGDGNGIGDGNGGGVGTGKGGGFGPGEDGNTGGDRNKIGGGGPGGGADYSKIFKISEVSQRARVLVKPQPEYTEDARRAQTTGTVRLSVVFSSSGQVVNIRPLSQLPFGLTEKAINAARRIQFSPAIKDGRPVSSYAVIEYNFNIY